MTDQKHDNGKIDSTPTKDSAPTKGTDTSHGFPTKGDKSNVTAGAAVGSGNDWNPAHHPLDGSPVLTAVPQYKPVSGQTGAKPKTVAQHNNEVLEMAAARDSGTRAGQE